MSDDKIRRIEINFDVPVALPRGFEQALAGLLGMVCHAYETAHPAQRMSLMAHGLKGIVSPFDENVYYLEVGERRAFLYELKLAAKP